MRRALRSHSRSRGFTLIELMIALVLGLLLVLGIVSVVTANSQAYRTNQGLSQIQESARTGFEILSRHIREAGGTGCGNGRIANTVRHQNAWWQLGDWDNNFENSFLESRIRGYGSGDTTPVTDGTDYGERIAGTGALMLQGLQDTGVVVVNHTPPENATIRIDVATPRIADNDILMVCSIDHAAIFQVTNYNPANRTVVHNPSPNPPGNCSKGLGFPTDCGSTNGNLYSFPENSPLFRLGMELWYVGANERPEEGGRSLFRQRLVAGGATEVQEMVAGVTDLQVAFRENNATTFTATPANWRSVNAVELTLTVASTDARVSTDDGVDEGRITRNFTTIVALRNRLL